MNLRKNPSWRCFKTMEFQVHPTSIVDPTAIIKNNCKIGYYQSKADKMVFDINNQWIVVDVEELHTFLKENEIKETHIDELLSKLDWNIVISK